MSFASYWLVKGGVASFAWLVKSTGGEHRAYGVGPGNGDPEIIDSHLLARTYFLRELMSYYQIDRVERCHFHCDYKLALAQARQPIDQYGTNQYM